MDRRAFIGILSGGLLATPLAAEAQPVGKVWRIGAGGGSDVNHAAFLQGWRGAGWIPGKNTAIERRSVQGEQARIPAMVAEIVALKVDVALASSPPTIRSFLKATNTIPIGGLDLESDPVASGFVASLARRGGNLTAVFLVF